MGRRKRSVLSLDTDSALVLMQEIYNDVAEQKRIASQIVTKMLTFMTDAEDMPVIGSVIDKQQKILQDCTEKKLSLVKLQSALLKQTSGTGANSSNTSGKLELSAEDKKVLQDLLDEKDDIDEKDDDKNKYNS